MAKSLEDKRLYQREYYKRKKKEIGQYYKDTRSKYYEEHKEEYAKRSNSWYSNDKNKMARRQKIHNIEFDRLFKEQKGLCAIGGEALPENKSDIHVDHDHETGYIRGLACRAHNVGLGMFNDSWELLEKAAEYVFKAKVRYLNEKI